MINHDDIIAYLDENNGIKFSASVLSRLFKIGTAKMDKSLCHLSEHGKIQFSYELGAKDYKQYFSLIEREVIFNDRMPTSKPPTINNREFKFDRGMQEVLKRLSLDRGHLTVPLNTGEYKDLDDNE